MRDNHVYPRQTDLGHTPGMELRDWFAGMVLQASCQESGRFDAARLAYEYADAMMEARNEEQTK